MGQRFNDHQKRAVDLLVSHIQRLQIYLNLVWFGQTELIKNHPDCLTNEVCFYGYILLPRFLLNTKPNRPYLSPTTSDGQIESLFNTFIACQKQG